MPDWAEVDHADACDPPAQPRRYDLVFSNSVLEHVGGHERRLRFAETVHALADAHWIQTPYRYFPIEPHWIVPGMQFLPVPGRASSPGAGRWATRQRPATDAVNAVLWTELVGRAEMRHYFPHSKILPSGWPG